MFLLSLVLLINIITKFCKHCGSMIAADAVICTSCGRQVKEIRQQQEQPQIVINNSDSNVNANTNTNTNTNAAVAGGKLCNKGVSFWLCLLLGVFGAHKFYEGKPLMGILYLRTMGLVFVGVLIDLIAILAKSNLHYA
ncbi:MAG: TM2 domain-containing protein [Oscillospiraceae bacterium]|nr:TM2 domain-containing protein [Oscillospiraceae bacterium]